jgi:hypothetical protein
LPQLESKSIKVDSKLAKPASKSMKVESKCEISSKKGNQNNGPPLKKGSHLNKSKGMVPDPGFLTKKVPFGK